MAWGTTVTRLLTAWNLIGPRSCNYRLGPKPLTDPQSGTEDGTARSNRVAASNALKHSQATEVLVVLGSQLVDGSVSLDIEVSNEISEAVVITEGTGLERMKMRARSLGGWADYASADGRFIVLASVPLALPKQK